jgi:hypothetical protein
MSLNHPRVTRQQLRWSAAHNAKSDFAFYTQRVVEARKTLAGLEASIKEGKRQLGELKLAIEKRGGVYL